MQRQIRISPQFWTSDEQEMTRGLRRRRAKFAFHLLDVRRPRSDERVATAISKICISPHAVLDVRRPRSDERVAGRASKLAFHHSFGRPTSTK